MTNKKYEELGDRQPSTSVLLGRKARNKEGGHLKTEKEGEGKERASMMPFQNLQR